MQLERPRPRLLTAGGCVSWCYLSGQKANTHQELDDAETLTENVILLPGSFRPNRERLEISPGSKDGARPGEVIIVPSWLMSQEHKG